MGGHFNIDISRINSGDTQKLNNFLKLNQLKQEISTITRPDSNATIDLLATNCEIENESGILNVNVSGHLPIYFIRKKVKEKYNKIDFIGRSYKNLNKETVHIMVEEIDWTLFAQMGVDDCWNYLYDNMKSILNKLCLEKKINLLKIDLYGFLMT